MSTKRKALRYGLKKQELGLTSKKQSLATSMKLLRSVLAVGFAMTPWLSGEALAAGQADDYNIVRVGDTASGTKFYLGKANATETAHIYAEQASGTVGLNRFTKFDVGANQIANLYFQTGANAPIFNTLVNTVENKINISGTVNAIRNNKIGGNLYFISPEGMVVGAGGVINAGSLTLIGANLRSGGENSTPYFSTAAEAAARIQSNNFDYNNNAQIVVNGQINTMTGIDLRAAHIALKKVNDGQFITPTLQTGVVFKNTVNTNGFGIDNTDKLTVTKDTNGNIIFKNSSNANADLNGATGDGSIKMTAAASQQNSCFEIFNIGSSDNPVFCNDTVEAKVDLGKGSSVAAIGDVSVTATATRQNDNNPIEFWDLLTYTNAEINVNGNVSGQNVNMAAKATSSFTGSNNQSLFYAVDNRATQIINNNNGQLVDININNTLTDSIMNTLLANGILGSKTQAMNNIVEQLYMPFSFVDAKASVNQGVDSVIKSTANLQVNAESSATNKLTVAIQPKVVTGSIQHNMPVGGGFVYTETNSDAQVNLLGKAEAGENLIAVAKSTNTSVSSMVLKKARSIDDGSGAAGASGNPYYALALSINVQDNNAVVNLGSENLADKGSVSNPRIKAGKGLNVNATTIDTVSSTAVVGTSSDTILNTAINIVDSDGKAEINSYVPVQGAAVNFGATELLNGLTVTTDGSSGVELTGLDALISTQTVKKNVEETIGPFLKAIREVKDNAAGSKVDLKTDAKPASGTTPAKVPSWNEYFSVGASVMVANVDNIAKINLAPGASITSTAGDLNLASKVTIGDRLLVTKNLLTNEKSSSRVGVSVAVAIEDMHNTAEVNVESSEEKKTALKAVGSVSATALADQSYNRLDKMVANLEKGWASAKEYWSNQGSDAVAAVLPELQIVVADLLTITAKDSATDLSKSKQHTLKAKAAVDLLANILGVDELKTALEAFCNVANYTNMYVSSSTDKMDTPLAGNSTAMATGTVGIQNLDNNATVKVGPHAIITAGNEKLVKLDASSIEQSFLMAGKWAFLPDIYTTDAGAYGIGGTVGVQNASGDSLVQVMNGVQINAGAIDLVTKNDVLNMGLVMGGARTSALGITGMLIYQGGDSTAQTLVDDDASLTALQKKVVLTTVNADKSTTAEEYEGVNLSADNNTIVIGIAGDLSSSKVSSIGVSTSVVDYNVKSLAVMENQEAQDTDGKGLIKASDVQVAAHTGGVINSLSVAGNQDQQTTNTNKQAGGASASTSGGKGAQGVENIQAKATDKTSTTDTTTNNTNTANNNSNNTNTNPQTPPPNTNPQTPQAGTKNPVVELKAAGSVSVNYIVDETRAAIDNVNIEMLRPTSGSDMTTNVILKAEDDSYIGTYSGAGALTKQGVDFKHDSKFSSLINGAVAFNEINKTTSATLQNSKVTNVDNVLNQSQNSGAQVALGLALGVDLAERMNNVSVNLGASGSFNFVNSTVQSVLDNDAISGSSAGSLNVNNTAYDKDVQVAGGANAQYAGSAAVGASVTVNETTNNIVVRMQNTSIGSQNVFAGSVNNLAVSNLVQVGGAISVGVTTKGNGNTYAVGDVAVATNVLENNVQAEAERVTIYGRSFNNEARDGQLKADESANQYIAEINSAPNTAVQVDVACYKDANGRSVAKNLNGEYVYEDTGDVVPANVAVTKVQGTGTGKYYLVDANGTKHYVVLKNGKYVYEGTDTVVDINAPVSTNIIDLDTSAALANANGSTGVNIALKKNDSGSIDESQHYTSQNVSVTPSGNVIVGSAIGVAVKAGGSSSSVGVAAATSVNDVTNSFNASVTGSTINVNGTDGVKVKAESNTVMVAVAAGAAASVSGSATATVDVAGSGVANSINNDTIAKVENSTVAASKMDVNAATNLTLVSVAGQLSAAVTDSYGGVAGLTWAQNSFDNTTGAYVRGISLNGYNGNTALNVNANNNSNMYTIGAGVDIAIANGALDGAYAANYGTNNTEAVVEKYTADSNEKTNSITSASGIRVQAKDDSDVVTVAGTLAMAVSPNSAAATVGGAIANTLIGSSNNKQSVRAALDDATVNMVAGANLSVQALNDASLANFALGGGVAASGNVGVSAQGSAAAVDIHRDTLASMNNTNVNATNGKLELSAQSDNDIVSSADAANVAFGSTVGVAGGAAISVVNSDADTKVEAKRDSGYSTWNAKEVLLSAGSENDIINVAMGLGVAASGTAGVDVEGNVAVNNINNDTLVDVAGASITAANNLVVQANSGEHLENYGGALSVGAAGTAGVGVGATVVVNTISGNTQALVDNSNLIAQGTGNTGIAVRNYTVGEDGTVSPTDKAVKGLVVTTDSKHEIDNVTVTSSIGGAGVAAVGGNITADVNEISGETKASILNSNINKDQSQNSTGDVVVLAHDKADISADVITVSGSGSGTASAAALGTAGTNIISRSTNAVINGNTASDAGAQKVFNAKDAKVYALGERKLHEDVVGVGVAASGAGAATLAATVSVAELSDTTLAAVKNMTGTNHSLDIDAERVANTHSYNNVIALSGSVGSGNVGCGVTVFDDKSNTQAQLVHADFLSDGYKDINGKVNVLANNKTRVETELAVPQIAISLGAIAGVAVECVNMEALVGVTVDDVSLGNTSGKDYTGFNAVANNNLYNKFTNATASFSTFAGAMVGVGTVNINSKTFTDVNNITAYADDITVLANEQRTANAVLVAADVAAGLTVGVNVMYTNIGDDLDESYDYYRGDNADTGAAQTGTASTESVQNMVNNGLVGNKKTIDSLKANYGSGLTYKASSTMNKGTAAQSNVGVGTSVRGNSKLTASRDVNVQATATNNVNNILEQVQASIAVVGVATNHVNVTEHQSLLVENSELLGRTVNIASITNSSLVGSVGAVPITMTGYMDTTGYLKHSGSNNLTIYGSSMRAKLAVSEDSDTSPLSISAVNNTNIDNSGHSVLVVAVGGGRLILEGEDASTTSLNLGNGTSNNNFKAAKIAVQAINNPTVKNDATIVDTGTVIGSGTIVSSKACGGAELIAKDKNTFDALAVELLSESGSEANDGKYTTEATSHAVSVTVGDITVNKVRTFNEMNTALNVGAVRFINGSSFSDAIISAKNLTDSNAYIHSVNVGVAGSGNNFAQTHDKSNVSITVAAGTTGLNAKNLEINAINSGAVDAKAVGTDVGILEISPFAARVEHESNSSTTVNLSGKINASGELITNAQRNDTLNLMADALSMTVAGGGDATVKNDVVSNTNIEADGASLTSAGDLRLLAANYVTTNNKEGFEQMIYGQGSGIIGDNTAGVDNEMRSAAKVAVKNSTLISNNGAIDIAGYSNDNLKISGYIYSTGLISGCAANVENSVENDNEVAVNNSVLKVNKTGKDLTLSAADDVKLNLYAYSEVSPAVNLANSTDANIDNTIERSNTIKVDGNSKLYSARDINLYAGKLLNGNVATLDLDAEASDFNASLIPVVLDPTVNNAVTQNNQITIDNDSSSGSARHTNLYADTGREMARIYSCRYTGWGSSDVDGGYVTTDSGQTMDNKAANNYVNINGSVVAGVANKVDITIGHTGDIVVLDDPVVPGFVSAERDAVVGVDGGALSEAQVRANSTVTADSSSGLTVDSLTFGRENYANELMKRYNEVLCLMSEYESDNVKNSDGSITYSPSYLGYQAEAERLRAEMLAMGLAEVQTSANGSTELVLIANMKVDYVETPELLVSGGNITVDTSNLKSSDNTGVLKAQSVDGINITNNTNLLLKVNEITVDAEGGLLIYNNQEMTASSTADINNKISALNESATAGFNIINTVDNAGTGAVNINGNYNGDKIEFKVPGETTTRQYLPLANIQVQGNIINNVGNVNITSANNNIVVQGETVQEAVAITGKEVNLNAGGSVIQGYTDGIVHIGGSPQLTYKDLYDQLKQDHNTVNQGYPTPDYGSVGSYIAGGAVYINATDINVNGVIQSGYANYYVDIIGSDVENKINSLQSNYNSSSGTISDHVITSGDTYKIINGGAVWDSGAGAYKYQLNVYYNPSTNKIVVEDIDANGGQIYLTGRISSTGNGKIVCLDGLSNISVNNKLDYVMQLGDLTVNETSGLVKITDTAGGFDHGAAVRVTTVTDGHTVRDYYDNNGEKVYTGKGIFSGKVVYEPAEYLRYTWTSGNRNTTYTRYQKDEVDGGWGLWSLGADTKQLAEWSVPANVDTSQNYPVVDGNKERLNGETIVVDSSGVLKDQDIHMEYSSKTDGSKVYTKESEERYTSGFFGCHTHYVVTWTESQGQSETYYASLKANESFDIVFVGNNDSKIDITSDKNDIELTGNIGNTQLYKNDPQYMYQNVEKGTVNITASDGSIIRTGGSIYAQNVNLVASENIKNVNVTAGDFVNLQAVNLGGSGRYKYDIDVAVESAHGAAGTVRLGSMGAATLAVNDGVVSYPSLTNSTGHVGSVSISAEGDITQKDGSVAVSADRINLNSEYGSIYGSGGFGLRVYAGQTATSSDTLSASLNATAKGNITLTQLNGDMRLGRVYSEAGDVTLTVNNGSVVDALPYEDDSRGDLQALQERWQSIGIIAGNNALKDIKSEHTTQYLKKIYGENAEAFTYSFWNAEKLLYALQNSIINPTSDSLATTLAKDPNVIGKNITINAANGTVGSLSGNSTTIDFTTGVTLAKLQALQKANPANVTCVKDASGKVLSATITDMQSVGVQQTVQTSIDASGNKQTSMGNIVINSGSTNAVGSIYLEGREQDAEASAVPNVTKDFQLQNINAVDGKVYLSSLGSIYNGLDNGGTVVNGKNLYITAVGSIGDANLFLTTALNGTADNEGLSTIARDGVYINQTGNNALRLIDVSSGDDIYLTSATSIVMGNVGGVNAVNYIRSEKGGDIVLEARNGSIGAPVYESDSTTIKHDENNGVRIFNAELTDASEESTTTSTPVNVTLRATEDIYVEGITDKVLQNSSEPGGYLNLKAEGCNGTTLDNVGIVVNGQLNLLDEVNSSGTASIYTTTDLTLDNNSKTISSKAVYLGSLGKVVVDGTNAINGTNSVTVHAGENVQLKAGTLSSGAINLYSYNGDIEEASGFMLIAPVVNAIAAGNILLDNYSNNQNNQLKQVNVSNTSGNIIVGSSNMDPGDLEIAITTPDSIVDGNLIVHNYAAGEQNKIVLADKLKATGNISIINEEANVGVGANADISAKNILLKAINHNVIMNGGKLTATEKVTFDGVDVIVSGGNIKAATAELTAADDISLNNGTIKAATASLNAQGTSDNENNGSAITEGNSFVLDVDDLQARAKNAISLTSQSNQLENVYMANTSGDVTVYNAHNGNIPLKIAVLNEGAEGAQINGSLLVHNYDDAGNLTNDIELDKQLKATGNITIINDETDIEVKAGAALTAQNITLQATNAPYKVVISGGTLTATSSAADAGVVTLQGNAVELNSGAINAKITNLTANARITENAGFALVTPELNASTTGAITLDSTLNQLEKVNILSSNNAVTIGSGNAKNANALQISTSNNMASLSVTNYIAGEYKNNIELLNSVTATGDISLDNQEGIVNISKEIQLNANNVNLSAAAGLTVDGGVNAQNTVSLTSGTGADLVLGGVGTIKGNTVSITSGQNFIHNGSTITATKTDVSGSVVINAQRNIELNAGHLQADNADFTAVNGFISESYTNGESATASTSYDLQIKKKMQVAAGGADAQGVAIDLGSRFNKLYDVIIGNANGDVLIGNGAIRTDRLSIAAVTTDANGAPVNTTISGKLEVHNYDNRTANSEIGNNLRVLGSITANNGITLINDERDITMGSLQATDTITSNGPIVIQATNNVRNAADIKSTSGAVTITANNDLINDGVVETASGNITLTSNNGMIFNSDNGDLLTNSGNVTLWAKGDATTSETNADYFYYVGYNDVTNELVKTTVPTDAVINIETDGAQKGRQYIMLGDDKHYIFRVGSVYNAGDIIAMNGAITLQSENGNVANFNDFKSFAPQFGSTNDESKYQDKDITTGSITMSAVNGKLINNVDLEAGENVTLIAKEGLANFSYNVYAGEDITLTATAGDLLNTSALESVKGNITLTAEHGNVINGTSTSNRKGDIITLGGMVTLKALGKDGQDNGYSVTNYGDIIAVNENNPADSSAGSIVLKSEFGDVNNYDDFNTYSKTAESGLDYIRTLDISKHKSVAGLSSTTDNSYNVATSNITLSAINGKIVNSLDYLVALGNVTMEAQEGIASLGQVILAGKDINLTDTDGDIFNRAKLISMNGDISLTATTGSVINMIDGDIYALNGNVNLHAKGGASDAVQYVVINGNNVETKTLSELASGASVPTGAIIVTRRGYMNGDTFVELKSGQNLTNGQTLLTQIGYLNERDNYNFKLVGTVNGEAEAFRAGDVVNRGDIVALNGKNADNTTNPGNINLISAYGNVANYDEFAVLDNGATQISYSTTAGITGVNSNIRFNPGTTLNADASYILSDANLRMEAIQGYLYNTMDMTSGGDLSLVSGKDLLIGVNVSDTISATGDVKLESQQGKVEMSEGVVNSKTGSIEISGSQGVSITNSTVSSEAGSIAVSGDAGVSITGGADIKAEAELTIGSDNGAIRIVENSSVFAKEDLLLAAETGVNVQNSDLQSLNGSLSAVAMYGEVNITELAAAEMVAVGSGSGSLSIGTIQGKEVVLYTENSNTVINVDTIKAQDSLVLQVDQVHVANEVSSTDGGQLLVDITGANGGTMQGELDLDLAGDVSFTNIDVSYATIKVEGSIGFDKLHTTGELHVVSQDMVTSVYGVAPVHDTGNYLYYSLTESSSSSNEHDVIRARDFALEKAQNSMEAMHNRLANAGNGSLTAPDGDGWMYLYIDLPTYQRSNGLLLHIDTGYRSANQRWSAEDLSGKLVDFKSHDAYVAHYSDTAGSFSRYDLLEIAPRSVAQIVQDVTSGKVVLQESNGQLRIAASQDKQDNVQEHEERKAANE